MEAATRLAVVALAGLLTACGTPPPAPAVPDLGLQADDRFAALPPGALPPTPADRRWWRRFDDPALAEAVERALAANPDLDIARERVQQAQALLQSARGQRGPQLGAQAGVDASSRRGAGDRRVQPAAALTLGWDTDLWGGLRQAEASAAAGVMQARHRAQAVRLATAGLAARAAIEWREAQADAGLLAQSLVLQQDVLRVVRVRADAGLSPRLDLERARADAAALQASAAAAEARTRQALSALRVLAGQPPGVTNAAGTDELADAADAAQPPPAGSRVPRLQGPLPAARPADLLRGRPDLRAAEQALRGAAADVGVAQADLLPRLRLPGTLALATGTGLLDTVTASLAAVLDATLFDGGQRRAAVAAAASRAREAAAVYRQTLLRALQQTDAAYLASSGSARQIDALQRASASAEAAVADARTLYDAGLSGLLDLLDARRTALAQQRELLRARADAARQAVAGFEALGLIDEAGDGEPCAAGDRSVLAACAR